MAPDKNEVHLATGPLAVSSTVEASYMYLAYTYIWGRPTETSEPYLMMTYIWGRPTEISELYLMMTYISWFTALRKKCSVSALRSVSQ